MERIDEITHKHKTGRGYAKNIPIEDIIELRRKDLTEEQIAQLLGCDRSNVNRRLAKYKDQLAGIDRFKSHRADILTFNQKRVLDSITDKDIKSASFLQRATAFGILYDKERLERGQSTENLSIKSITQSLGKEVEEIARKRQELMKMMDEG